MVDCPHAEHIVAVQHGWAALQHRAPACVVDAGDGRGGQSRGIAVAIEPNVTTTGGGPASRNASTSAGSGAGGAGSTHAPVKWVLGARSAGGGAMCGEQPTRCRRRERARNIVTSRAEALPASSSARAAACRGGAASDPAAATRAGSAGRATASRRAARWQSAAGPGRTPRWPMPARRRGPRPPPACGCRAGPRGRGRAGRPAAADGDPPRLAGGSRVARSPGPAGSRPPQRATPVSAISSRVVGGPAGTNFVVTPSNASRWTPTRRR